MSQPAPHTKEIAIQVMVDELINLRRSFQGQDRFLSRVSPGKPLSGLLLELASAVSQSRRETERLLDELGHHRHSGGPLDYEHTRKNIHDLRRRRENYNDHCQRLDEVLGGDPVGACLDLSMRILREQHNVEKHRNDFNTAEKAYLGGKGQLGKMKVEYEDYKARKEGEVKNLQAKNAELTVKEMKLSRELQQATPSQNHAVQNPNFKYTEGDMRAMQATIDQQAQQLKEMQRSADDFSMSWQERSAENEELRGIIDLLKRDVSSLRDDVADRDGKLQRWKERHVRDTQEKAATQQELDDSKAEVNSLKDSFSSIATSMIAIISRWGGSNHTLSQSQLPVSAALSASNRAPAASDLVSQATRQSNHPTASQTIQLTNQCGTHNILPGHHLVTCHTRVNPSTARENVNERR